MGKIIFATGNAHKMVEIRMILADLGMEILSQKEAGIQADVVEDGSTFEENAMIKATEIAKIVRQMPEYFRGSLYFQRLPALHCTGY